MEKYQIIYADPPWAFKNKNTGGNMKSGATNHYKTMNINDIKKLPIKDIAAENCVLFMWWVGSMPSDAIELVKEWGFEIKTMTGFVWVKKTKLDKMFFGMGFWTRQGAENCLIAIKGKPKRINAGIRSVITEKIGKHSEKPEIFKSKIVDLIGDVKRIELFARKNTEGWDVFGNEVENSIKL